MDTSQFEIQRRKLIADALSMVPPEHRESCIRLQQELTEFRAKSTSEEFLVECARRMGENLCNLGDAWISLGHCLGAKPPAKTPAER